MTRSRSGVFAVLGLLWLALIVSVYFAIHKPFAIDQVQLLLTACWQILVGFFLLSLCGGVGGLIMPALTYPPAVRLALQAGMGLGIMGIILFIAGVFIGFGPLVLIILLGGVALIAARPLVRWWTLWRDALGAIWRSGRFEKISAGLAALIFIFALLQALAPPIKFDALVYHLALPQTYLQEGHFVYLPWLMFWGMPQMMEMFYTAGMAFGGAPVAAVFGWWVGLTAFLAIIGLVQGYLGMQPGWVAGLAILSGYTLTSSLAWGYVEWGTILLGLCFLAVLVNWIRSGDQSDLMRAGLFAGFAIGIKYSAGVLFLAGIVVLVWGWVRRQRAGWRSLLMYSLITLLATLPWLLKNLVWTGNPIYPFLLPAGAMDALRLSLFQGLPVWGNFWTGVTLPIQSTLFGVEGTPGFSASIGPLFLGLGLLAWIGWGQRSNESRTVIGVSGLILIVGVLVWALLSRFSGYLIQTRLYLSLVPAGSVLVGAGFLGLDGVKIRSVRLGWVAGILILVVVAFNLFETVTDSVKQGIPAYLLASKTTDGFLTENLDWYYPAVVDIKNLPPGSKTLMLWEPRSYYCSPDCLPDEVIDRWKRDFDRLHDPEEIRSDWLANGFTHLLLYRAGMEFVQSDDPRYRDEDWSALNDLIGSLTLIEDYGRIYQLYDLR